MQLLLLAAIAMAALAAFLLVWRRRSRSRSAAAAQLLCDALDSYLEKLAAQDAVAFDGTDALWSSLERARALKRQHFPQLYPEMAELSTAHAEWAGLQLSSHMERHGAPTDWHSIDSPRRLAASRERVERAARALRQRCREVSGLTDAP